MIHRWPSAIVMTLGATSAMAAPAEKALTLTGIVQDYSAAEHRFAVKDDSGREMTFAWTKETKFNGVVANGAHVTVRYTPQPGGANLAQTVGVLK